MQRAPGRCLPRSLEKRLLATETASPRLAPWARGACEAGEAVPAEAPLTCVPTSRHAPGAGQDGPRESPLSHPRRREEGENQREPFPEGGRCRPACELRVRTGPTRMGDGEAALARPQPSPPAAQVRAGPGTLPPGRSRHRLGEPGDRSSSWAAGSDLTRLSEGRLASDRAVTTPVLKGIIMEQLQQWWHRWKRATWGLKY